MKKLWLLVELAFFLPVLLTAQSDVFYTVHIGTFLDARLEDFSAVQPLGFVYAYKLDGDLYQVFVGGYDRRQTAENTLDQVRRKGYTSAYIQERQTREGQNVMVIQMATKSNQQAINWSEYTKIGNLYVILEDGAVKIATGTYPDAETAKSYLASVRNAGFRDAFIKPVNTVRLHTVSAFETGTAKQPLIPLSFDQPPTAQPTSIPPSYETPPSYDRMTSRTPGLLGVYNLPAPPKSTSLPNIRTNVKRTSVLELQKALKAANSYTGSLDGYYGSGTAGGFESVKTNSRELKKYLLLSQFLQEGANASADRLQQAINTLLEDSSAPGVIESSYEPVSQAYQAYLLFTRSGPSAQVNQLMNNAIRGAYAGKRTTYPPPVDANASYAYTTLDQLILHLVYIHGAPGSRYAAPCWLAEVYPDPANRAFAAMAVFPDGNLQIQKCDPFTEWEEIGTLQAIAVDLNADKTLDRLKLAEAGSLRSRLYATTTALNPAEKQYVDNWNQRLWNGLNRWATTDPMHQRLVDAMRIVYFQSQVRLEDFYMDKGFDANQAEGLALATLQALVGYHLQRFI